MRELMEYNSKILAEKGYTREEINSIIESYREIEKGIADVNKKLAETYDRDEDYRWSEFMKRYSKEKMKDE